MLPTYLTEKTLTETVTGFEIKTDNKTPLMKYLISDADLSMRPIHKTCGAADTYFVNKKALYVRLLELNVKKNTLIVVVSRNQFVGIRSMPQTVLQFDSWNPPWPMSYTQLHVSCVDGLLLDTHISTLDRQWKEISQIK